MSEVQGEAFDPRGTGSREGEPKEEGSNAGDGEGCGGQASSEDENDYRSITRSGRGSGYRHKILCQPIGSPRSGEPFRFDIWYPLKGDRLSWRLIGGRFIRHNAAMHS